MPDKTRYKEAEICGVIFVASFVVSLVGWSLWVDKARDKIRDKE